MMRVLTASLWAALLLPQPAYAQHSTGTPTPATASPSVPAMKQGYWWYAPPPEKTNDTAEPDTLSKPVIPPMAELARWTPPKIRKLIEDQRDYAATVLSVDAVSDFWRLQDFARRKARAFAGVTQIAMLQHPELNAKSANPMVSDARDQMLAQKDGVRRAYLRARSQEFALVMFSRASCGYCPALWGRGNADNHGHPARQRAAYGDRHRGRSLSQSHPDRLSGRAPAVGGYSARAVSHRSR